jgi:hypothetical protein
MPGLFLILPFSSSPEDGMVFLTTEACGPKRNTQEENSGAFHISGLANQTTSRYKLTSERVLEDNDC